MRETAERAKAMLAEGASALEVVCVTVMALEDSGLYVAGRGASPNLAGQYELDASLMTGHDRDAAGVAALQGFRNPIAVARRVMEATRHVLLVGQGAAEFARAQGCDVIEDPGTWFTHAAAEGPPDDPDAVHGTVGCVALDRDGRMAAATSTSGTFGKMPGRVGDTPIIGAGSWADDVAAASGTGYGEYFIRTAACAQTAWRVGGGASAKAASEAVLDQIAGLGGNGGLIVVTRDGEVAAPFNSQGMKCAVMPAGGEIRVTAFERL